LTNKDILEQYGGIKAELRQIEDELSTLRSTPYQSVVDCVKGSSLCPPYQPRAITIRGVAMEPSIEREIARLEARYEKQRKQLYFWLNKAEDLLSTIPDARIRTILRYRYVNGLDWWTVADKMGGRETNETVKKVSQKYFKENL